MTDSSLPPDASIRRFWRRTALRSLTLLLCVAFFGLVTSAKLAQYDAESSHTSEFFKSTKIEENTGQKHGLHLQEISLEQTCVQTVVLLPERPLLSTADPIAPERPAAGATRLRSPPSA